MAALVNPGDRSSSQPLLGKLPRTSELSGRCVVVLETGPASQFKITADQLEAAITPKQNCLF